MSDPDLQSQALQRRSYELSILNDVARALNASVDLPALLARALEKVAELLGLSTGWVLLFDETSGEPYLAAAQNLLLLLKTNHSLFSRRTGGRLGEEGRGDEGFEAYPAR